MRFSTTLLPCAFNLVVVAQIRDEAEAYYPGTDWYQRGVANFHDARMTDSIETSTQYSPPMTRSVTTQNCKNLGVV
ncbi:unnamed protein product [Nippostrongylus brasiliensis]|uniref:Uncharacterized protein n=1 Tax=Nippostrongylus brasiliensis TaxID=27835 RepID=A0A0N4XSU8_NIPBR|nr:unnamed protein product [Nippostrongylus brasiliensis]